MYDRSRVVKELGVAFTPSTSIPSVEQMVSLGLRRNKKRAHLLVSRVLGKHIPQDPRVIEYAAHLLSAKVGMALNPEQDVTLDIQVAEVALADFLDGKRLASDLPEIPAFEPNKVPSAVVVGFAETATGIGFNVAAHLGEWYVHSTRNHEGREAFLAFEEEHSHATSHALVPDVGSPLEDSSLPVVLVDDEFSTGKTAMNIIEEMNAKVARGLYVIAALVDCRSEENIRKMEEFSARIGVDVRVVALASGEVKLPDGLTETVWSMASKLPDNFDRAGEPSFPATVSVVTVDDSEGNEHSRFGTIPAEYLTGLAERIAHDIPAALEPGDTLVLGQEELMHLPLMVAKHLADFRSGVYSSTTTRSPILVMDEQGYPVTNGVAFDNGAGEERFAYNVSGFGNIVLPLEPGQDWNALFAPKGLIQTLSSITENIIIVGTTRRK